jgi:hypothetical protein
MAGRRNNNELFVRYSSSVRAEGILFGFCNLICTFTLLFGSGSRQKQQLFRHIAKP